MLSLYSVIVMFLLNFNDQAIVWYHQTEDWLWKTAHTLYLDVQMTISRAVRSLNVRNSTLKTEIAHMHMRNYIQVDCYMYFLEMFLKN